MNKILNFIDLLATSTTSSSDTKNPETSIWVYVILIVLVVLMLVLPMITQKKRNKEYAEMLDSLNVGDTIKTIGGVIGRVTKISEKDGQKSFILETGAKGTKTTMEFDIAAVAYIVKSTAKKEEPKEAIEAAPAESETAPAPADEVKEEAKETKPAAKKSSTKKTTKKTTKKDESNFV